MKRKSPSKRKRDRYRAKKFRKKICDGICKNCPNWRCFLWKEMWRTAFRDPENNETICIVTPIDPFFKSPSVPIRRGDVLTQGIRYTHPALRG